MVGQFLRVNMANLIVKIKWKELAEYALLMEKYKKDSSWMEVKMDLEGQFIPKVVTI